MLPYEVKSILSRDNSIAKTLRQVWLAYQKNKGRPSWLEWSKRETDTNADEQQAELDNVYKMRPRTLNFMDLAHLKLLD